MANPTVMTRAHLEAAFIKHTEEIERLRALLAAAPDPAFYRPEEYNDAWLRWKRAQGAPLDK